MKKEIKKIIEDKEFIKWVEEKLWDKELGLDSLYELHSKIEDRLSVEERLIFLWSILAVSNQLSTVSEMLKQLR